MTRIFIQQSYNASAVNIYPDDITAVRWLSLIVAKFCKYSFVRDDEGGWVGVYAYTTDKNIINKIVSLYENEVNSDVPAWSPQSRETNMKMSDGYRDYIGKQKGLS